MLHTHVLALPKVVMGISVDTVTAHRIHLGTWRLWRVHATTEYGRDAVPIQWAMRTIFGAYDNLSLAPVKLVPFKY